MLLTLTTTHEPATDLGFLLGKHPDRAQTVALSYGAAHVVWPEATAQRATVARLVDVDPVALVRGRPTSHADGPLEAYVNDRPCVATSHTAVAIGRVFRSALAGTCPDRPELVDQPLPLEVRLGVVACRGGPGLLDDLFAPLGYAVQAERLPRDETVPAWGPSPLYRVRLTATVPVGTLQTSAPASASRASPFEKAST